MSEHCPIQSSVQQALLCTVPCTGTVWLSNCLRLPCTRGTCLAHCHRALGHRQAVLPSSQLAPECPGQHLHSRAVTVLYITLYVGLTTVL